MTEEQKNELRKKLREKCKDTEQLPLEDEYPVFKRNRKLEVFCFIGIPILVAVVALGCFIMIRRANQYASSVPENVVESEDMSEAEQKQAFTGEYSAELIEEAVKGLYSEEQNDGSTWYYSVMDTIPNTDGTYRNSSVYANSDANIAPIFLNLKQDSDTEIQMYVTFIWYTDTELKLNQIQFQLPGQDDILYSMDVSDMVTVSNDNNGYYLYSVTIVPTEEFVAAVEACIEAGGGQYTFVGATKIANSDFTENQLGGFESLIQIMNGLEHPEEAVMGTETPETDIDVDVDMDTETENESE